MALLSATVARADDPARTVLILRAESAGLDDHKLVDALKEDLQNRWPSRLHFYEEDVDPGRFSEQAYRHDLPDYVRAKHGGRIHLLVVLSNAALEFVIVNRRSAFSGVPVLFAGASWPPEAMKREGITGVAAVPDFAGTVALALELHPKTRQIAVVGGTARSDQANRQHAMQEVTSPTSPVRVMSLPDLPFNELTAQVAALPADTVVLYTRLTQDAAGSRFDALEALQLLRQAAPAQVPFYGTSRAYVGAGVVGGVVIDQAAIGRTLGRMASAILAGESPTRITPVIASNVKAFDWHEVRRLALEARLPADAQVDFREPAAWDRYAGEVPYLVAIVVSLSLLAGAVVVEHRKRRSTQRALEERLLFEKDFADVWATFINASPGTIDTAVRGALHRLLETTGADCAAIYEAPSSPDAPWKARFRESRRDTGQLLPFEDWDAGRSPWVTSKLRAGRVVPFQHGDDRAQLLAAVPWGPPPPAAAVVAPTAVGPSLLGAVWCLWLRANTLTLDRKVVVERFRLIGDLFANALQRSQMEDRLAESAELNAVILASLVLHVAVLNRAGTIIAVNDAWLRFGRHNHAAEPAVGPGANYLEAARRGAEEGAPSAQEAFDGIRDVCEGRRQLFALEYDCSTAFEQRWYLMTVAALRRKGGGAVVTHKDITASKETEKALRESEGRFRLLADALPVGVWMSDVDGRRNYFNRTWLDFTGRDLHAQLGDAWIYNLHPDDGGRYVDTYRAALAARAPFTAEYRVRRHDNTYGWFLDNAVPRYGSDGAFMGLVGGCLNVTRRKEAEDALHDLTGRVIKAEEEDRRRIARDLHDGVNQLVALLAIEIEQLGQRPIASQSELASQTHALWNRAAEISSDLHRLSHSLHPTRLETFGLVPALEGLCAEITQQTQLRVLFSHRDIPSTLAPDLALCVFRITQEAIRNAVRHSGAAEAVVELWTASDVICLRVSDNGSGFDTGKKASGLGLVSMRERARFAGGSLVIDSRQGNGTRVEVRLPLNVTSDLQAPAAIT